MVFINNIRGHTGVWREHYKLIKNILDTVQLFYMPEVHNYLVPMLLDFVFKGNNDIKELSCHCLAKILKYQHNTQSRDELLALINKELMKSSNWKNRRSFIFFCKYAIKLMSRENFKRNFLKDYMALASDRVPHVRMEFVNSLLVIKPYFDSDPASVDISEELVDLLMSLTKDNDRDVIEAAEHTDFELLSAKRKGKSTYSPSKNEESDEVRVAF